MEHFSSSLAIIFIVFISIESILSARLEFDNYHFQDSLSNFSIALVGAVLNLFFKGVALEFYLGMEKFAPVHLGGQWWNWILLFFLTIL